MNKISQGKKKTMPLPTWPCTLPLGNSLQEGEPKGEK